MTLTLLLTSFLAGGLSVLAPCILPMIPILLSRGQDGVRHHSPVFVIGGLAVSIIIFSILLKSTTLLIDVPVSVWSTVSGVIVILFGIFTLLPNLWEKLSQKFGFALKAQQTLGRASVKKGKWGDILLGASLGPVFSACSPTYALIVASILPADPVSGMLYLIAFVAGLCLLLGLIAVAGQSLTRKLGWGLNPHGLFRRILGVILIIIGIMIVTGLDKMILTGLIESGVFDWQINLESGLMQ